VPVLQLGRSLLDHGVITLPFGGVPLLGDEDRFGEVLKALVAQEFAIRGKRQSRA
jgi:hypothetical protein